MTVYRAILLVIALERFGWYLFLGALALWHSPEAVGNLLFASYLLPLFGGWLGGRLSLRSVTAIGATLLLYGYICAATNWPTLALVLLACGCGLFKPCLATLLGSLYPIGTERTKAYSRFYAAIQVGSMPSTLVGGWLHYRYGWAAAFGACIVALACALSVLALNWRKLQLQQASIAETVIDHIVKPQWSKVIVLLVGATVFFAGFQQQQTTLVLWARDVCRVDLPESVSTLNPVFAFLLLFSSIGAWTNLRGRLSFALLSLALAFGMLCFAGASVAWLGAWYALATVGEVLISPLGMDLITTLVPRRLAAVGMALWLLSMALGGKLAGMLGSMNPHSSIVISLALSLCGAVWFYVALSPKQVEVLHEHRV